MDSIHLYINLATTGSSSAQTLPGSLVRKLCVFLFLIGRLFCSLLVLFVELIDSFADSHFGFNFQCQKNAPMLEWCVDFMRQDSRLSPTMNFWHQSLARRSARTSRKAFFVRVLLRRPTDFKMALRSIEYHFFVSSLFLKRNR